MSAAREVSALGPAVVLPCEQMGRTSKLMAAWWHHGDPDALGKLLEVGACRSDTRSLINAVGTFGEYLAWRAVGGERLAQASG